MSAHIPYLARSVSGALLCALALTVHAEQAQPASQGYQDGQSYLESRRLAATPDTLIHAAMMHDTELVAALIATGMDPDARGSLPQSALQLVTGTQCQDPPKGRGAQLAIMELLIGAGANVRDTSFGNSEIVIWAAQQCPPVVVERLLEAGANIEARSPQGFSPLSMALMVRNYDTAAMLIEQGARLKPETVRKLFADTGDDARLTDLVKRAASVDAPESAPKTQ